MSDAPGYAVRRDEVIRGGCGLRVKEYSFVLSLSSPHNLLHELVLPNVPNYFYGKVRSCGCFAEIYVWIASPFVWSTMEGSAEFALDNGS